MKGGQKVRVRRIRLKINQFKNNPTSENVLRYFGMFGQNKILLRLVTKIRAKD